MSTDKKLLLKVILEWMKQIETRLTVEWDMTDLERAHLVGKYRAYNEIREILTGEIAVFPPVSPKKAKKR